MKSILMYEFGLINPIIEKVGNKIYIKEETKNKIYILEKIKNEQIKKIWQWINKTNEYYQIIPNKNGKIEINYNGEEYILYLIDKRQNINEKELFQEKITISDEKNFWYEKWSNKIDKIREKKDSIKNDLLKESVDYYLGMSENAMSIVHNGDFTAHKKTICHRRITDNNRNPQNTIIDYKERDIAEYIKYLFFMRKHNKIYDLIRKLNNTDYQKKLIYGRVIFPTYYLDLIEEDLTEKKVENSRVIKILNRKKDYEELIISIEKTLFQNEKYVDWIKKI